MDQVNKNNGQNCKDVVLHISRKCGRVIIHVSRKCWSVVFPWFFLTSPENVGVWFFPSPENVVVRYFIVFRKSGRVIFSRVQKIWECGIFIYSENVGEGFFTSQVNLDTRCCHLHRKSAHMESFHSQQIIWGREHFF